MGQGKVLYAVTMSLDGFIAGPGGDMSWLTPYLGSNPQVDDLQGDIGALLVGHRTFGGDDPNRDTDKEGAFSGTRTGPTFVLAYEAPVLLGGGTRLIDYPGAPWVRIEVAARIGTRLC